MNALPLLIGGGALGALLLVERDGRSAGKANAAAMAVLEQGLPGVSFTVPKNGSMVDAHAAMRAAIGDEPSLFLAAKIGRMWLDAWEAGAKLDPANYAIASSDALTQLPGYVGGGPSGIGSLTDPRLCDGGPITPNTPLGKAVCAVRSQSVGDLAGMLDATARLARAMDDADYRIAGTRRSDRIAIPSIAELPGRVVSAAVDAVTSVAGDAVAGVVFSPIGAAAILGFVAWRVL